LRFIRVATGMNNIIRCWVGSPWAGVIHCSNMLPPITAWANWFEAPT